MGKRTRGAVLLEEALRPPPPPPKRLTQQQVAEAVGVTAQTLRNWWRGSTVPDANEMLRLQQVLGVPFEAWGEAVEGAPPPAESAVELADDDDRDAG